MTIGEISIRTGISESALRYYEKKGLIRVSRDAGGRRDYSEADIAWVQFLQRLKNTGMPLREIQRYSDLRYLGESTMQERLSLLQTHRHFVLQELQKWKENLHNLDQKIAFYEAQLQKDAAEG